MAELEKWQWQEPGRAWKGVGLYHITLTIPDRQMQSFIIATNTHDQNVMRLDGQSYTFKSDDEVEVIAGKFKGVRGKVIRAGRQQRILIELAGFMTFATAYVPTDFIRKI